MYTTAIIFNMLASEFSEHVSVGGDTTTLVCSSCGDQ